MDVSNPTDKSDWKEENPYQVFYGVPVHRTIE